ncbi:hypothetical protein [Polyangium fumosum]|uniref:Uncharacterized protein n=1 Tax=Polyangium fumosum TaxID=889272 RepID=A0A4U1IUH0_9BACT|nr:hypothetical protein [Polyangium fumosum]TKC98027.1 hypothetical protein E8A74_42955 [Polyangium fumosum]
MAYPAKRVAEYAVVVWAAERLRRGLDASASLLCDPSAEGPLLGFPQIVGVRLVRVCEELGLLHRKDERIVGLTPEGERVAEGGEPRVFIPQLGAWAFFWAEDPLLLQPLLRVEPWKEPTAHAEAEERRRRWKSREQETQRPIKQTPRALLELCDAQGMRAPLELPATQDGRPIRLVSLDKNAEIVEAEGELAVEIAFLPGATEGSLRLRGSVAGKNVDQRMPALAGWDHARVFWELLRHNQIADLWNAQTGKLRIPFRSLQREEARKTFRLRLPFKGPEISGLGRFEDMSVEGIPIEPASQEDAQRWFEWLLVDRAAETQWPELYTRNTTELGALFPGFTLRAPAQGDLAHSIRGTERPRPAFWHLQATIDLDGGIQ